MDGMGIREITFFFRKQFVSSGNVGRRSWQATNHAQKMLSDDESDDEDVYDKSSEDFFGSRGGGWFWLETLRM